MISPRCTLALSLLLAVPLALKPQTLVQPEDQWQRLSYFWNPFADKVNRGIVDLKAWRKVVAEVDRIEGRKGVKTMSNLTTPEVPELTPTAKYNLLIADMYDRLPAKVIESPEGQQVIAYFEAKIKIGR